MLAATTQPVWTPSDVIMLVTVISSVFVVAVVGGIIQIINAQKAARIAIIEASRIQGRTEGRMEQISTQVQGLQTQVTNVAASQTPQQPTATEGDKPKGT